MPVHSAPKIEQLSQATDPKKAVIEAVGDLTKVEVFSDMVLMGTYIRSEKTASGKLLLPADFIKEDEHQSKVGLVLKTGPLAYADWEEADEQGKNAQLHTWVVFAIKDTWAVQINGTPCRFVPYERLRARIVDPKTVY